MKDLKFKSLLVDGSVEEWDVLEEGTAIDLLHRHRPKVLIICGFFLNNIMDCLLECLRETRIVVNHPFTNLWHLIITKI